MHKKKAPWRVMVAGEEQKTLADGTALRLLSSWEVLEANREAESLAKEERERALCANACILARAWVKKGIPICASGEEILRQLTVSRIQELARLWAAFDREANPSLLQEDAVDTLKKVWSMRRLRAFNGVCSGPLARFQRKNASEP